MLKTDSIIYRWIKGGKWYFYHLKGMPEINLFTHWLREPPEELIDTDFVLLDKKDYGLPFKKKILKSLRMSSGKDE